MGYLVAIRPVQFHLLLTNLSFPDNWAYIYTLNPNNGESAPLFLNDTAHVILFNLPELLGDLRSN
jgi:hypothetical protein